MRFPIRFKILVTMLLVITAVVSIITFTMANLFHTDKESYIHALTSEMAQHTAAEARSILNGYRERLQVLALLMTNRQMPQTEKAELIQQMFFKFQEFVAVTLHEGGLEPITVYDAKSLTDAGLTKEDFLQFRKRHPLPLERISAGNVYVATTCLSEKLPAFTLAISFRSPDDPADIVAAAIIRLDTLLDLVSRSKIFSTFIVDYQGTPLADADVQTVVQGRPVTWIPNLESLQQRRSHGLTHEFLQNGTEMIGGLAGIEFGDLLAGAQIPKSAALLTSRELLNNLLAISLVLLVASAILSLFWSGLLTRPIERLNEAAKSIGKGEFDTRLAMSTRDEIGDLAGTFNQMASQLMTREEELKEAHEALIQSEKMSAFGQIGAGIAHEVKNPLAGILGLTQLSLRETDKTSVVYENLTVIEKETRRCKTIIENLMKFARQEKFKFEEVAVNRVVEDAIAIIAHQLGIHKIKIFHELAPDLPAVWGNANQIQQVLLNLLINAQQAMEGAPGSIRVVTRRTDAGRVLIGVKDNGPGIPEELKAKIFEPFFTTKPIGKGTGLGLSVSYGIVKEHKGRILVESQPGKGTVFMLIFPAMDSQKAANTNIRQDGQALHQDASPPQRGNAL